MALKRRNMLGIMLNGRSVTVAEVRLGAAEHPSLQAVTRLDLDDLTWKEPAKIGVALAEQLRAAGIKASHAVVGLPAAWVLTRSVAVPPAQGETLRKLVANKAERAFAAGGRDMAIDFVATAAADAMTEPTALLVATQQQRVDDAIAMAEAAGLSVDGVTATTAVLAATHAEQAGRSLTLTVSEEAAELAIHDGRTLESIRPLRKVAADSAAGTALANQLRQVRMLEAGADTPSASAAQPATDEAPAEHDLWLWDAIGLDDEARRLITTEAGALTLRDGQLDQWVHANGALTSHDDRFAPSRFAGAVALALTGLERQRRPVDWLHSRLAAPRRQRVSQAGRIAIGAGSLVLALALAVGLHYREAAAEVAGLETQLETMAEDVTEARAMVDRVTQAEGWFVDRPSFLACLEALTEAFGDDAGLWATEVSVQGGMEGTVSGVATESRRVLDLRDRMQAASFANVALVYLRDADRGDTGNVGWAITFRYVADPASPAEAPSQTPSES